MILCIYSPYLYFARDNAYSTYSQFGYALQHPLQHQYNQQFLPQMLHHYYGPAMSSLMQMMAPLFTHSPAHASQTSQFSDPPATTNQDSRAQRRKKTVERHRRKDPSRIELFRENEDMLCYRAFNSPEWQSIATQLHERMKQRQQNIGPQAIN